MSPPPSYMKPYETQIPLRESKWNAMPIESQSNLIAKKLWTAKGMKEANREARLAYNQRKRR